MAVVSASTDSWHRRPQVGRLTLGPSASVSHEAAAALHGFDRSISGSVEFSVPRAKRLRANHLAAHTTTDQGPTDIVIVGRAGVRRLDRLLTDTGGESMLERRFLALVRRAGLAGPETQVVQRRNGRHVAGVDFLFRRQGVVVEVTGRLGHSTPTDAAAMFSASQ